MRERFGCLGQLDLAGSGTQEGFESRLTHHCRGVLQPLDQHPHDGDRLVRVDTHIKKYLRVRDGLAVHSGQDGRVGILDPRQADRALQALQQLEVQPGRLADLSRRQANPVLAHHPIRRQQQRSDRGPNLVDAEAAVEEPRDQLGTLGARLALEPVEQPQRLEVDVCCH